MFKTTTNIQQVTRKTQRTYPVVHVCCSISCNEKHTNYRKQRGKGICHPEKSIFWHNLAESSSCERTQHDSSSPKQMAMIRTSRENASLMSSLGFTAVKRHHDQGNSYNGKHLIGASLQFQRFSLLSS